MKVFHSRSLSLLFSPWQLNMIHTRIYFKIGRLLNVGKCCYNMAEKTSLTQPYLAYLDSIKCEALPGGHHGAPKPFQMSFKKPTIFQQKY